MPSPGFNGMRIESDSRHSALDLNQLSKPFWFALMVGSVSLLLFVSFLTILMDRGTLQSSERVLGSIFNDRMSALEGVVTENGYWDQAVEEVIFEKNDEWIEDNFIDSMLVTHQLSNIHVFNGNGDIVLNIVDGKIRNTGLLKEYTSDLEYLIESARVKKQGSIPQPVSAFVGSKNAPYLASAINMTTYNSQEDINTDHILLIAKKIDGRFLANIRQTYNLWGLEYRQDTPNFIEASLPIHDSKGNRIGQFIWNPSLAGKELLPLLVFGVLAVFVAMLLSARTYLRRATKLIHELEYARLQAEFAQAQLDKIAHQDPLTGLGNRRSFENLIERVKDRQKVKKSYAFMSIDLDGFKQINDTFGHEVGDSVLQHFATMFEKAVGESGDTFRLGGDEFCAIMNNSDRNKVIRTGKKLIEILSRQQKIEGHVVSYGASIGVSFSENVDDWMSRADTALYAVKRKGKGRLEVFEDLMDSETREVA